MKSRRLSLLCLILVLCGSGRAAAQSASTGQITGTVRDPSGVVLPEALVVVKSPTGLIREVRTDEAGRYVVPLLPPGAYRLEISRAGFKTHVLEDITVRITETTVANVNLEIGELAETITVEAEEPLLQADRPTTGRVIIHEGQHLEFRAEFFNAFNIVNFANPGSDIATPATFGIITQTSTSPRLVQFALRYSF